jgi:hypothetical protein
MDFVVSTIEFQYEDDAPRVLELTLDVTTTRLSVIRTALITQSCPEGPVNPSEWVFTVNGREVGFMDAANRYGSLGMNVYLRKRRTKTKAATSVPKKRDREEEQKEVVKKELEKIHKETEGIPYEAERHLAKILRQNEFVFRQERESNGVLHQWMFMMMGHISTKIPKVALPFKNSRLLFNTEPHGFDNNMTFIMKAKEDNKNMDTIVVCPYVTMRHAAMMCYDKRRDRLLHFDSSSTLIPINEELFRNKQQFRSVSYTFINYQAYDDTNFIVNLAGGNCGMFSGLNAIQCLLKYNPEPVSFVAFWARFLPVLKLTDPKRQNRIVVELTKRIQYVVKQYEVKDLCRNVMDFDPCPLHMIEEFPDTIRRHAPEWADACDFTCDYIILGYFLEANVGFDQVTKLGNAFRLLLQDIQERGFISIDIASAVNRLCSACSLVEAKFECACSAAKYCGKDCQALHWEEEHKKMH